MLASPELPSRQGESQPCFRASGGTNGHQPDVRMDAGAAQKSRGVVQARVGLSEELLDLAASSLICDVMACLICSRLGPAGCCERLDSRQGSQYTRYD